MKTIVYSKDAFVNAMKTRNIDDTNVSFLAEYFICIDPTSGLHARRYFFRDHVNVIRLEFDDCVEDTIKWGEDIQEHYNARAMTRSQAEILVKFIKQMPVESIINIYCTKGKSRSVAVESFINSVENGNPHVLKLLREVWTGK
jgi:predicted protein tyrosine phosphatase